MTSTILNIRPFGDWNPNNEGTSLTTIPTEDLFPNGTIPEELIPFQTLFLFYIPVANATNELTQLVIPQYQWNGQDSPQGLIDSYQTVLQLQTTPITVYVPSNVTQDSECTGLVLGFIMETQQLVLLKVKGVLGISS